MKITELRSENVKRLQAVQITPEGSVVVIGGKNGQGKSSILDSIAYALGGEKLIPSQPLRRGEQSGRIWIQLDGDKAKGVPPLVIERRFNASGTTSLSVKAAGGALKIGSPQTLLNSLYGRSAIDPVEFSRMKPADQVDTLKKLVGLDFAKLDGERKKHFDARTETNREAKRLEASLASTPRHDDAPEQEVSVAELMAELKKAREVNAVNEEKRQSVCDCMDSIDLTKSHIASLKADIVWFQKSLQEAEERLVAQEQALKDTRESAEAVKDVDIGSIETQIAQADAINAKVRANQFRAKTEAELAEAKAKADQLTHSIEKIDTAKELQMSAATWPIDGLGFSSEGITFNGLPFDQASSAEQLKVSVAIGLVLNPTLRVLLIRDGSLLDADSLALVAQMAEEAGGQVWVERVSDGEECSVVIEDGQVRQVAATAV